MAMISLPGGIELCILAIIAIYWYFIITTILSIIRRQDLILTNRLLWVLIIVVAPLIGILIYNLYGRPTSKA